MNDQEIYEVEILNEEDTQDEEEKDTGAEVAKGLILGGLILGAATAAFVGGKKLIKKGLEKKKERDYQKALAIIERHDNEEAELEEIIPIEEPEIVSEKTEE